MSETSSSDRTVVIAMDGSHFSAYAFQWYIKNIRKSKDHVILVHSHEVHFHFPGRTPEASMMVAKHREESAKTKELMDSLSQRLKDAGVSGKVRCESGNPGQVVVRIAEEEDATLIVTGCRGQGTVRRTIMGSVSDYIIHHSHVPVIVCRHKEHCFQHKHRDNSE